MAKCAVGLMAKYPQRGQVKTRLAADIGADEALRVYNDLLSRAIAVVSDLKEAHFGRAVFVTPSNLRDQFKNDHPELDAYWSQSEGDLGVRMNQALALLLSLPNINKAILIGTDIPEIDGDIIQQASDALDDHDCVIGPTVDGGYYLIGMREVKAGLFQAVAWGTPSVLSETLTICGQLGLAVRLLPELRDLDDLDDLKQFAATGVISVNRMP
ncbi:MAG: TIGR04282 family arsenosugar biosynthesis glycosyltransferase [candidate division Zixibacteria bacterium]|nr:TIGR04282 family arsenosugar biosynthesis glycosyltransferase [candidate division Zixibacteria bacterium]MDH3936577.1 TIGR04282 family arsenosugar biosynthesis glycosyltransferase [candidate division Zixibacteria bacterium]MDH4034122.1 TIGR04282 family arsenosugar biosynthesis glycosyltransferase [candidate division Zixibacteria bacterium]